VKVAWFSDQDIWQTIGGATLTDRLIVEEGIRRGHSIELVTPRSIRRLRTDLIVFSNMHEFLRVARNEVLQMSKQAPMLLSIMTISANIAFTIPCLRNVRNVLT